MTSAAASRSASKRYVPRRELGRGGMGHVELVLDRVRGQLVARKRVAEASGIALLRFKNEFRAIERLRHPNLVQLFELGQDEGGPFFTMEAVDGVDLAMYCRLGEVALERSGIVPTQSQAAAAIGSDGPLREALPQLLAALAFLHEHGVAHGDLKPSNILVRRDGALKLLDFGVIARFGQESRASLPGGMGTPVYMAPELFEGRAGPASDVYALGVILLEAYLGRREAHALVSRARRPTRAAETIGSILAERRGDIDATVADAVDRMLAHDPKRRPTLVQIAGIFGVALPGRSSQPPAPQRPLAGRDADIDALLARLERCYDDSFAAVALVGATGVGKTSLANEIARTAERGGAATLRGRAHLRERVPFNGVDDAIDALALLLMGDDDLRRACSEDAAIAAALFPALTSTPLAKAPRADEDRAAPFAAVVRLLERIAARRGALLSSTVGSEAWNSRDLKSRPH